MRNMNFVWFILCIFLVHPAFVIRHHGSFRRVTTFFRSQSAASLASSQLSFLHSSVTILSRECLLVSPLIMLQLCCLCPLVYREQILIKTLVTTRRNRLVVITSSQMISSTEFPMRLVIWFLSSCILHQNVNMMSDMHHAPAAMTQYSSQFEKSLQDFKACYWDRRTFISM